MFCFLCSIVKLSDAGKSCLHCVCSLCSFIVSFSLGEGWFVAFPYLRSVVTFLVAFSSFLFYSLTSPLLPPHPFPKFPLLYPTSAIQESPHMFMLLDCWCYLYILIVEPRQCQFTVCFARYFWGMSMPVLFSYFLKMV